MRLPGEAQLDHLLARAQAADQRARAEERRALHAEDLATSGSAAALGLHLRVAGLHRQAAQRHRVAARLHRTMAGRLRLSATPEAVSPRLLAHTVSEAFGVPHAAAVLSGRDGSVIESQGTAGLADTAQDLELVLGEGPLSSASACNRTVEADGTMISHRWSRFGPAAADSGVQRIFAAPLTLAGQTMGAVALYNCVKPNRPRTALEALAEVIAILVTLADVGATSDPEDTRWDPVDGMTEVHQAAGYVAASTGCDMAAALSLIQARAYAESLSLASTAREILDGTIRIAL